MDFTLIIPTHNRHEVLKYSMEYYNNCSFEVVYVDSSDIEYLARDNKFSNISYRYLRGISFASKLLYTLETIQTRYVGLCADDDFLILDSVFNGISFLENKQSIKAYIGSIYGIKKCMNNQIIPLVESKNIEYTNGDVKKFFMNYSMILWGLYNKKSLIKSMMIIEKSNLKNDNFIELILGTVLLLEGGIKQSSEPWLVRDMNQPDNWGGRHKRLIIKNQEIQNDFEHIKKVLYDVYDADCFTLPFESYIEGIVEKRFKNNLYTRIKSYIKKRYRIFHVNTMDVFSPVKKLFSEQK